MESLDELVDAALAAASGDEVAIEMLEAITVTRRIDHAQLVVAYKEIEAATLTWRARLAAPIWVSSGAMINLGALRRDLIRYTDCYLWTTLPPDDALARMLFQGASNGLQAAMMLRVREGD